MKNIKHFSMLYSISFLKYLSKIDHHTLAIDLEKKKKSNLVK